MFHRHSQVGKGEQERRRRKALIRVKEWCQVTEMYPAFAAGLLLLQYFLFSTVNGAKARIQSLLKLIFLRTDLKSGKLLFCPVKC